LRETSGLSLRLAGSIKGGGVSTTFVIRDDDEDEDESRGCGSRVFERWEIGGGDPRIDTVFI